MTFNDVCNYNLIETTTFWRPLNWSFFFFWRFLAILDRLFILDAESYLRLPGLFLRANSTVFIDFCTFLSFSEPDPRPPGPKRRRKPFSPRKSDSSWKLIIRYKISLAQLSRKKMNYMSSIWSTQKWVHFFFFRN